MSAKLLLDHHVPPKVAEALWGQGHDVVALTEWRGGAYRHVPDDVLLLLAREEQRVLVTFDVNTLPAIAREFVEDGVDHAGVVLVSNRTIAQNDVGPLVRALVQFLTITADQGFTNRTGFLTRP
jgi:hypothetical protein